MSAGNESIAFELADGFKIGFTWADSSNYFLRPVGGGQPKLGTCSTIKGTSASIFLNKDLIKDAGDLFCVLSHELTHAFLGKKFSAMDLAGLIGPCKDIEKEIGIFTDAVAYSIEWRIMSYVPDEYLTEKFKSHVKEKYAKAFLYYKLGPAYDR